MASDRYDDGADGPRDVQPEQHRRPGGSAGDAAADRAEPAGLPESRSRAECYAALRAADGQPEDRRAGQPADGRAGQEAHGRAADGREGQAGDARPDRSGWDAVEPGKRPPLDALRVTPERVTHILDGDQDGRGGHRHGTGNPGKTEFPASWDDQKIMDNVRDVARRPEQPPIYQSWNGRWLARGTRDDVEVVVVVAGDGRIWSGWPRAGGPGVVTNPRRPDGSV
jgi:hypothetical protein